MERRLTLLHGSIATVLPLARTVAAHNDFSVAVLAFNSFFSELSNIQFLFQGLHFQPLYVTRLHLLLVNEATKMEHKDTDRPMTDQ